MIHYLEIKEDGNSLLTRYTPFFRGVGAEERGKRDC